MYRVTIYNGNDSIVIHEPTTNPSDPHLYSCSLTQGASGEIDSLTFEILPNNPGYEQLFSRTTMITVTDLNTTPEMTEFTGRVLMITPQMEESGLVYKQVVAEDRLGFLCDSIQPYTPEATYELADFFTLLLENHNSQVEDYKKIYPGNITVTTSSGNVTKGLNYQTTWEAIKEKLLDSVGGEIQLYSLNGLLYLDYVPELGSRQSQTIELGKNMVSIDQAIDPTTVITRLIPLGAQPEPTEDDPDVDIEDRLTIASVNDGKIYLDDEEAQAVYGVVEGVVYWDDVTLPENLKERGQEWLDNQTIEDAVTLSALDLSLIGLESGEIERYNYYRVINPAIGMDTYLRVAKRTVDICEPENITFEMGTQAKSLASTLTDASNKASSAATDAMAAVNAELSKTVTVLIASNAQILQLEATVAYIESAYVTYEEVGTLVADLVQAAIGEFDFLTVDEADIRYASIDSLDAINANIVDLTAFAENVYTLLGGTGSFGELETIHLTSDNAVIDEAVIVTALMDTVLASVLTAGVIYTDYIKIANNENRNTWIDGGTIQFTDGNGVVREQLGVDASGIYNNYIWDEDGNIIWNALGLTEEGLTGNGAIIKDAAVADDANISGYKLNIEEICSIINTSEGVYTIEAASVTIDGQGLDVWYTQINEAVEGLEGLTQEGLTGYTRYYCYWDSATEAPPNDEDITPAICGEAVCGLTICGLTEGNLWQEEPIPAIEGVYRWCKLLGTYQDGHTEWGLPYCMDDGYAREQTQVLQTQLTVVQGLIDAKVWESDIESYVDPIYGYVNTIEDQYAELTITVNGIYGEVGDLQTTVEYNYQEFDSRITSISADLDGISMTVSDVQQSVETIGTSMEEIEKQLENIDGVTDMQPYWCLWNSGEEAPPDNDDLTPAICGEAVCGLTICGVTDGQLWTTTEPVTQDGLYEWVKYELTFIDGHTEWRGPYCLTDVYTRSQISSVWSNIDILDDRITQEVGNVQSIVDGDYEYLSSRIADIEIESDSISLRVSAAEGDINDLQTATGSLEVAIYETQTDIISYINASADVIYLEGDRIVIDSEYFKIALDGTITSTAGTIGGWRIGTVSLEGGEEDNRTTCIMQIPRPEDETSGRFWTFASGGRNHSNHNDCVFRVGSDGRLYASRICVEDEENMDEARYVRVRNDYGSMQMRLNTEGTAGLYNVALEEWICFTNTNGTKVFGTADKPTYLRGSNTYIYGSVYTDSGIDVAGSIISGASIYLGNSYYLYGKDTSGTNNRMIGMTANNNVRVGNENTNTNLYGVNIYANGSPIATTSDRKFKYDVTDLEFLPDRDTLFDKLTPREYTSTFDNERHMGFVYQEVVEAEEESGMDPSDYGLTASFTDDDGETVGAIRYEEIISLLVYEVQQLKSDIAALKQ